MATPEIAIKAIESFLAKHPNEVTRPMLEAEVRRLKAEVAAAKGNVALS